jgi:hypothetical protein
MLLVETERCMMRAADKTVIVADSTKFGRSSLARMCEWNDVDTLVVDDALDLRWKEYVGALKTQLLLATAGTHQADTQQAGINSTETSTNETNGLSVDVRVDNSPHHGFQTS